MTRNLRILPKRAAPIWVFALLLSACGGDGPANPDLDPHPPVGLAILSGDEQVRWPGATLIDPLWVQAVDDAGAPVHRAGIPVAWSVQSGGGTVVAGTSVTNENGTASTRWTLGPETGPQRVEARLDGAGAATFSAVCAQQGPVLFSWDRNGSSASLFMMNEDGSHVMRLVNSQDLVTPDWSPDGSQIVAALDNDAIVTMDARGDFVDPHPIVNDPPPDSRGIVIERPVWSPDGSRIAFSIKQGAANCQLSDYNIFTVDPDGGNRTKLTDGCGGRNTEADWSPDGSRIVFTSRRSSTQDINTNLRDIEIWVMDADGSDQTRLTFHGDNDTSPTWAPSGNRIFFARWPQLGAGGTSSLWQMDSDGASQELVREFVGLLNGIEVSPDGLSLLLEIMDLADFTTDLFGLEISSGELRRVTAWGGSESIGSWRHP